MSKVCSKCGESKSMDDFGTDKAKSDGKRTVCKPCTNAKAREFKAAKSAVKKLAQEEAAKLVVKSTITKVCSRCKVAKSVDDFPPNQSAKYGLRSDCRECFNAYAARNKLKCKAKKLGLALTPEEDDDTSEETVEEDTRIEAESSMTAEERAKHKADANRAYMNKYMKERYKTNVNYKVKTQLSSRLRQLIYMVNRPEFVTGKVIDFLGCTMEFYMDWMEFQFTPGMTRQNAGEYWHNDHVRPCNSYDLAKAEDIKECFHWSNMQPLTGSDNSIKHDNIDQAFIDSHKILAQQFLEMKNSIDVPRLM